MTNNDISQVALGAFLVFPLFSGLLIVFGFLLGVKAIFLMYWSVTVLASICVGVGLVVLRLTVRMYKKLQTELRSK